MESQIIDMNFYSYSFVIPKIARAQDGLIDWE